MATPHQAQYQGQVPQQHQNVGQQRQVPNGHQQQAYGQAQQRPVQAQQQPLNPYANYDPQLASFILEKPRGATSWEDAEPEKQHVALQELQSELHKFRRNHGNVKKNMNEIPSPNCRRIINELVEDQNVELAQYNRAIQYRIASVVNKWRSVNRRERQLVRVDIILETEPSGFQEPMPTKMTVAGGPQDPNKVRPPGNPQGQQFSNPPNPGQNMPQQQRPPQQQQQQHVPQHNVGQGQHFEPPRPQHHPGQPSMNQMPGGNPPPPPPPPAMAGPHDMPGPPHPPMNGGGRPMPGPIPGPIPGPMPVPMQHPQPNHPPSSQHPMPGTFPEQLPMPPHHMRQNQGRPIEVLNPNHLRHQKQRRNNRRDASSSSSDSESSWEDESENSSFVNIEHDDHIDAGRRERGRQRHSKKQKKSYKHRSTSKARGLSRSRSQSRARRINVDPYTLKPTRRRRASDLIDDPRNGRLSPESFTTDSSRSSHNKIPGHMPPVHIHLSTNNVVEDRTRNGNASPADLYNEKRKPRKQYTAHDMGRESSSSLSERGSGTESMNTTSAHTADDGIWDRPIRRRPSFKHVHSRRKSSYGGKPQPVFDQPHPSHIYDDEIDYRRAQKVRYPDDLADDYPHARSPRAHMREPESYFDDHAAHAIRPNMHHRRATMANPPTIHNPFAQTYLPAKPIRASSYLADRHDPGYSFPQPRALTDREEPDERFGLSDIHAALEHIQEKKDMRHSMRRPNVMGRRDSALQYEDEWNSRVPLGARRGGYDRF
ncbi:hypothetical protein ACET3X_004625 [Alternaria dauci]|uniref:Uncharacterized protein n=1 Tax=Alternaria dauci TaxID=48095 RepID=A0ABR3UQX7_9PLEO